MSAEGWIVRPEFAAPDWPATNLRGRPFPLPLALHLAGGETVSGRLTRAEPAAFEIDDGACLVPLEAIRAYAILHEQIDGADHLPA